MKNNHRFKISAIYLAFALVSGCNSGGGSSIAPSTPNTPSHNPLPGQSFDYIAPFKDYNHKVVLSVNQVKDAKSLSFHSNFEAKAGWGSCFGIAYHNIELTTSNHITTIKPKTDSLLSLTQPCDIMGTDTGDAVVLPGVEDPQIYSVSIVDENGANVTLPINHPEIKDPGNGYENAGYYAQWSVWGRKYNPYKIPVNNLNHIIYAFIGFDPATGNIKSLDASADSWGLSAVTRDVAEYPYMKASLSFGGWTNNGMNTAPMFEELASSQSSMNNFATQAVQLMQKTGFTGIDIDWEWWSDYPNKLAPAQKMLALYKTVKAKLDAASAADGKHYTLSIAVNGASDSIIAMEEPSNPNHVAGFWAQVNNIMDRVNVMSYDYHGSWDITPAYFQATQDISNVPGKEIGQTRGLSIKSATGNYIKYGIAPKKLVVGIPLYGRSMTVDATSNNSIGLLENVTGAGIKDYEAGILDYKCIVNPVYDPENGCGSTNPISGVENTTFYNTQSNVDTFNQYGLNALQPWGYNKHLHAFLTYDDVWSATEKTKYVINNQLGGTMYWEIDGDATKDSQSIISAVRKAYNQK